MNPSPRFFRSYARTQLRNLPQMLSSLPETSIEEIFAYAKEQNMPKLWEELAETVMFEMNFSLTERCYLEKTNFRGRQFVKRVWTLKEGKI
jgi:WD repeat-containing protein 35